jgi:hypothetical protein
MEQYKREQKKQVSAARSVMNYVMGAVFVLVGLFFAYVWATKKTILGIDASIKDLVVALTFFAYGVWRIYRGYKKNYFNE